MSLRRSCHNSLDEVANWNPRFKVVAKALSTTASKLLMGATPPIGIPANALEMYSEELAAYRLGSNFARIRVDESKVDLVNRIDPVPKDHVACADVVSLFENAMRCGWCSKALRRGMEYALPDGHSCAKSPPRLSEEDSVPLAKKKGVFDRPAPPLTGLVSAAFRHLWKVSNMFRPLSPHSKLEAVVSAFFVEKGNDPDKLRVIINARWSNIIFNPSFAKFSFFSLETLRQVIHNLVGVNFDRTWYAINLDIRHWFHEIPLPHRYSTLFGIPLTDRKNKGKFILVPRAFPMGWTFSPIVAQSLTWALVLSLDQSKKHVNHPAVADLDVENLVKHNDLFTWVPFKSGGGIFVILDNILVVSPKKETAEYWYEKITSDAERYRIVLKVDEGKNLDCVNKKEKMKKQCFFTMKKNYEEGEEESTFEFLGISWYHGKHCVRPKKGEDNNNPNASAEKTNYNEETNIWSGTHRDLASVVGRLMWHRRCHDKHFFDGKDSSLALLSIFKLMTPSTIAGWKDTLSLPRDLSKSLKDAWLERSRIEFSYAVPLFNKPERIIWTATDAALSASSRVASVFMYQWNEKLNQEFANCKKEDPVYQNYFPESVKVYNYDLQTIANGELFAIYKAVKNLMYREINNSLVVLATDSMNAKRWVEAGKSQNFESLSLLRKIHEVLKMSKNRLYLIYVHTSKNVADYRTRPDGDNEAQEYPKNFESVQCYETARLLMLAEQEAKHLWMNFGGLTGGTNEQVKDN